MRTPWPRRELRVLKQARHSEFAPLRGAVTHPSGWKAARFIAREPSCLTRSPTRATAMRRASRWPADLRPFV
eukprot:3738362-Alexandrium_andersonii.AAC.1